MLDLTPKGRDETGEADGLGPSSRPLRAGNAGEVCADARLVLLGARVRGASRRQRLASWLGKNISRSVADRSRPRPPRRASSAAYTIRASAAGWSLAPRQWQARRFSPRSSRRYSARACARRPTSALASREAAAIFGKRNQAACSWASDKRFRQRLGHGPSLSRPLRATR